MRKRQDPMSDEKLVARTNVIVVGVDGSPGSDAALSWAFDEARSRQATLRVLHTWAYPAITGIEGAALYLDPRELADDASKRLDGALRRVFPDEATRRTIEQVVVEGGAANALIEQSKNASMVVVGARGHGGFVGLLLGSVSNHVVHHGECPIVVVPKSDEPS